MVGISIMHYDMDKEYFTDIRPNSKMEDIGNCIVCSAKNVLISTHKCKIKTKVVGTAIMEDLLNDSENLSKFEKEMQLHRGYIRARERANSRNIEFTLSFKKYKSLKRIKYCYYTGVRFDKGNMHSLNYPTLERLDSTKAYSDDNVVVCIKELNIKKGNLTIEEIKSLYLGLKKKGLV